MYDPHWFGFFNPGGQALLETRSGFLRGFRKDGHLTLHQLRIFRLIAKHRNITKASAELRISQPSVSQQAKLLEEEYGAKLYKKMGHGIQLTDAGRSFLRQIELILDQVDQLKRKFGGRVKGAWLTIGGSHSPSASFLPLLTSIFNEAHPQTQLTFRTANSDVLERLVIDGDVEIAVVTNRSKSPHLVYEPCREEELVFIAASDYPLAQHKNLSIAEIAVAPLVVFKKGRLRAFQVLLDRIQSQGLDWNVVMYCESSDALKAAVKAKMGLGITYKDLAQHEIARKELKIIQVPELSMRSESFIIYHRERPLSEDGKAFLRLLRGHCGNDLTKATRSPPIGDVFTD
jgi:DNA-binding transcriptional LysR family regulator